MSYESYRNRHSRIDHHSGVLPGSLVALSSALHAQLPEGASIEDAIRFLQEHIARLEGDIDAVRFKTFTLDVRVAWHLLADAEIMPRRFWSSAFIRNFETAIVDDKHVANWVWPPAMNSPLVCIGDAPTFTADITDPEEFTAWTGNGNAYTGWLGLMVTETVRLRIHTFGSGMVDTLLAIWGPREDPPGYEASPWHISDDALTSPSPDRWRSSLHDRGSIAKGTLWAGGSSMSVDQNLSGIELTPGAYWLSVMPYDGVDWDTAEGDVRITIIRVQRTESSFSADAKIAGWFLAMAVLKRERTGSLTANSIAKVPRSSSISADAIARINVASSWTTDAYVAHHFWADSYILPWFTIDAEIVKGFFRTDALIKAVIEGSFSIDSMLKTGPFSIWSYMNIRSPEMDPPEDGYVASLQDIWRFENIK